MPDSSRRSPARILVSGLPDWRTVVSAVLIVAAFTPWGYTPLIWFALVPWLFVLRKIAVDPRASWKRAFKEGLWLSILMSLLGFYWVAFVLHEFGSVPWFVAGLGLVAYSTFGQLQFVVFAPVYRELDRRVLAPLRTRESALASIFSLAVVTLLYTGIDWLLPKLFRDTLGHSMNLAPWVRQLADLGGAHLITFLIVWVNLSLLEAIEAFRHRKRARAWMPALTSLALVAAALLYGRARAAQIQAMQANPARKVQAAVIQANIGDFDKIAAERGISGASEKVISTYIELSREALKHSPRPELIVWPETAYPSTFGNPVGSEDLLLEREIQAFVRAENIPLLFGGYDRADGKDFNALFLLTPDHPSPQPPVATTGTGVHEPMVDERASRFGETPPKAGLNLRVYRKNILLLFGEYVPFTENSPFFRKLFPQIGNFGRGIGPDVVQIPLGPDSVLRAGPIICYEALFPEYVAEGARKGSELILNITNDSWFGAYGEPKLHLSLTTFRSIETRLPQLRSTNTGISGLILPDGSLEGETAVDAKTILYAAIPVLEPAPWTLMKAWGDWFGPTALLFGLVLAIFAGWLLGAAREDRSAA